MVALSPPSLSNLVTSLVARLFERIIILKDGNVLYKPNLLEIQLPILRVMMLFQQLFLFLPVRMQLQLISQILQHTQILKRRSSKTYQSVALNFKISRFFN